MSPQEPDSDDNLQVFLRHIERGFVQSNPTLREGLMHIIPFLTFGVTKHMNVLLQHFAPYLNFEKYVMSSLFFPSFFSQLLFPKSK